MSTNAERQKKYREGRAFAGSDGNGERRLNTWISTAASQALTRIAQHYGVPKREILEGLILGFDDRLIEFVGGDDHELDKYLHPTQDGNNPPRIRTAKEPKERPATKRFQQDYRLHQLRRQVQLRQEHPERAEG
ncbi:MAG: hypothetical protein KJ558_13425 [Gammaproteobacteria bacterium]|nr:hypothetical protein [Gammaproteobacteria bacterium]MBU1655795.1 hypothetical protein [Gammaproteobacteria bacterium]MBU1960050.1 hypothetical protein [Gammaproteobacteria bacterium]